jgi:hypothetical protein
MSWAQQRQHVNSLSEQALGKIRDARRVRDELKSWTSSYLGSLETLAWVFAIGSFWAAGRSTPVESSATRRSLIAVVNTSLLAWQLVNRQVELARPSAVHPAVKPR